MAYNKIELFDSIISKIKSDKMIMFMYHISDALGIAENTIYDHFPVNSEEMRTIKSELLRNRAKVDRILTEDFLQGSPAEKIYLHKNIRCKEQALNERGVNEDLDEENFNNDLKIVIECPK